MTLKEAIRYKTARKRKTPYGEDIITKPQSLFGENLVVDPYFYLIPLQKELSIRKYSRRTIKFYMRCDRDFLLSKDRTPKNVDDEDIKKYLYYVVEGKTVSQIDTINLNKVGGR